MTDDWKKRVESAIEEFRSFLRADFPPLKLEMALDHYNHESCYKFGLESGLLQQWGVYLTFDESAEKLLYVGNTTRITGCFKARLKEQTKKGTIDGCDFVAVIPFDTRYLFLAPALEMFLISKFEPPANTQHKANFYPKWTV